MNILKIIGYIKFSEPKDRRFFLLGGAFYLVIVLLLFVLIVLWAAKSIVLSADLSDPYKAFNAYTKGIKNYPSPEREAYLMDEKKRIDEILAELREYPLFYNGIISNEMDSLSVLKFKEKLFAVKTLLRNSAYKHDITLPADIGFSHWTKSLPPKHKIPDLLNALELVNKIIKKAILTELRYIDKVEVSDIVEVPFTIDNGKNIMYRRNVYLEFRAISANALAFLEQLWDMPELIIIENLKIERVFNKDGSLMLSKDGKEIFKMKMDIEHLMF